MKTCFKTGQFSCKTDQEPVSAMLRPNTYGPRERLTIRSALPATAILACALAYSGIGFDAKGGAPGPPPGGESPNNLSVPGVVTGSATTVPHNWNPPSEPLLGVHYACGCDLPESDGQ